MKGVHRAVVLILLAGCAAGAAAAELDGALQWAQRIELGVPVSGVITEVAVDAGDAVGKGQVLLRLDDRGFQAALKKTKAHLQSCRENRDEAERELERAQEMYDRTLLADHDLQMAKIAVSKAEAALAAAEAERTLAALDLEYSQLKAPFDGWVLERRAAPGQAVVSRMQSTTLLTLVESARMRARIMADADELAALAQGTPVQVRVAGKTYSGRVQAAGLEPIGSSAATPRYPVDVIFETGSDGPLRAGQAATVVY